MKIGEQYLNIIQRNCQYNLNKVAVTVDRNMLSHTFNEKRKLTFLVAPFLYTNVSLKFIQNQHEDKIRIAITPRHVPVTKKNLFRDLEDNSGVERTYILERVKIIVAMAISIVTEGAKGLNIYDKYEYKRNIIIHLSSKDLEMGVPNDYKSLKDFEEQVECVFNYLWFNYPSDITGQDNDIIRFSLRKWDMLK